MKRSAAAGIVVTILLLFAAFITAAVRVGLFGEVNRLPVGPNTSVAITLVGTFLAAIVSLVGVLLKYSADDRAEKRLRVEQQRNAVLQHDTEQRLKLDVAIRAIELLPAEVDDKSSIRQSAALFVLASLHQYELTLALVTELLLRKRLRPTTAARVLDAVFTSGTPEQHVTAASLLAGCADKFVTDEDIDFPPTLLGDGVMSFSPYVRNWIYIA